MCIGRVVEILHQKESICSQSSLGIVSTVMPSCHPGFLFHIFRFTSFSVHVPLLSFDPDCIITGNLVFIFGPLKKATPLSFYAFVSLSFSEGSSLFFLSKTPHFQSRKASRANNSSPNRIDSTMTHQGTPP